jgi:eukaryotic-like serine/threonine-protein kinase
MLSGLAADRNRRPQSALLLAGGLQTIADQMEAAGTSRQISDGSVITHPSHQTESTTVGEITVSELPPATTLDPSFFPPPSARMSGFEPTSPYPAPVGSPVFQPHRSRSQGAIPVQATRMGRATPPGAITSSKPVSYYVLLGVSALALFAISMFITILVLR